MAKQFEVSWCHEQLLENVLSLDGNGEMSPDFVSLTFMYVDLVKKIMTSSEPSNDIKLEWLVNLDCAYESIVATCGFLG